MNGNNMMTQQMPGLMAMSNPVNVMAFHDNNLSGYVEEEHG